ncbi:hypothetical protein B0H19DRAFT_1372313 [Mycena capillaripes]|nr:hypothetical protein B0H19DRAFT_1372313 [Mycena capillaripes]
MEPSIPYLHLLPVELWLACFTLCSLRQLRRISMVCRLFRSLVFPQLFRYQTFDMAALQSQFKTDDWVESVRRVYRTAERLDRLAEDPFAPLVRSWTVTFRRRIQLDVQNFDLLDNLADRISSMFSTKLSRYQNLSTLHIQQLTIDNSFRKILVSLSRLEHLNLCDCDIVAREGERSPVQLASPDTLRTLDVGGDPASLITGFASAKLHHLADLSVHEPGDIDAFFKFLARCPRLESLEIRRFTSRFTLPSFHRITIPFLRTLAGPPQLIPLFPLNHPLGSMRVLHNGGHGFSTADLTQLCAAIPTSSVPLYSLALPPIVETKVLQLLEQIAILFPELRELSLEIQDSVTLRRRRRDRSELFSPLRSESAVDQGMIDLSDVAAFGDLPADEISDDEAEALVTNWFPDHSPLVSVPFIDGLHEPTSWLVHGFSLPATIEVLRLETCGTTPGLPPAQQQHAIAVLGHRYPRLREVQFGTPSMS